MILHARHLGPIALTICLLFGWMPARAASIDIMLVYDNSAMSWLGSSSAMNTFSAELVNRMNLAMQNSGIDIQFRHAHSMSVDYDYSSFSTDLVAMQRGTGVFAAVHEARDLYDADLIGLLVDTGSDQGVVGLGYVLNTWSGSPNYAYTANAIRAVALDHTLTHEAGHNLGAHHAKAQSSDPGPNSNLDDQYSAGWYFTGTDGVAYHSIMAYNYDGYGGWYDAAPLFSTPLKTYQGTPAGDASDGDNARLLGETKCIVAGYRSSALVDTPEAAAATDITSSSFTANWNSVCDISGYRLDVSTSEDFSTLVTGYAALDVGTGTSQAITGLEPDTSYHYRVRAYNDLGTSADSATITASTEADDQVAQRDTAWRVSEIYIATMGYAPDDEGLQYWVEQIRTQSEWNPTTVAQSFFDQDLVKEKYPSDQDDTSFVEALYLNIFGRASDADGLAYWLGELESGSMERNEMIIAMIEGGWDNALAEDDMARFGNRVEVALAFASYQAANGIIYSALSEADQGVLRQAGEDALSGVTSDTDTRDAAIDDIPDLLSDLIAAD